MLDRVWNPAVNGFMYALLTESCHWTFIPATEYQCFDEEKATITVNDRFI